MTTIRVSNEEGQIIDEVKWPAQELDLIEKVNGPAAAALIAAGIGAFTLGLFTVLAEASTSIHDRLEFDTDVGPLSGKTVMAVVAYVVSWAILAPLMWKRSLPWATVLIIAAILVFGGFLGTFPPFFQEFASE